MRLLTTAIILAATAASSTAAFAQAPRRISDVDFIRASRCAGIAAGLEPGAATASALKGLVEAQGRSRDSVVLGMGQKAGAKAASQVRFATDERRAGLAQELQGACQKLVS